MTVLTSDIIKRAQQLADLENSSFIGWKENVNLLTESFQNLYQKIINHGEKYYLKSVELTGGTPEDRKTVYPLPDDFFELYALNLKSNNQCILRKSVNAPISDISYDIINSNLVIYGPAKELIMQYNPIPQKMSLKAPARKINVPELRGAACFDSYDHYIAYAKETETSGTFTLSLYDMSSNTTTTATLTDTVTQIYCVADGFYVVGASVHFYPYYDLTEVETVIDFKFIIDDSKNYLRVVTVSSEKILVARNLRGYDIAIEDVTSKTNLLSILENDLTGWYSSDEKKLYYVQNNVFCIYDLAEDTITEEGSAPYNFRYIFCNKFITNVELKNFDGTTIENLLIGFNKASETTGYGYTTLDGFIKGCYDDSELDIPNNLFYQMLSFMIAIAYKAKQNASADGLLAQYNLAWEQFYDSISNDDNGFVRIKNDY